jgi:hypothetical protein
LIVIVLSEQYLIFELLIFYQKELVFNTYVYLLLLQFLLQLIQITNIIENKRQQT